jgi:hypothetical protein
MVKNRAKMSLAIVKSVRECIILLSSKGLPRTEISKSVNVPYSSVLKIINRYKIDGLVGLETNYDRCGRTSPERILFFKRICLWLKRHHSEWGAPFIRMHMTQRYGSTGLPSIRQMQKWFKAAHLNKPRQLKGQPAIGSALEVHNIWQIDAKERFTLTAGQAANYLTIVDEKSGAWLEAPLFPLRTYQSSADRAG